MAKAKTALATDKTLMFWCPGCDEAHGVPVEGLKAWGWNGSVDTPTLTPSIIVKSKWPMVDGEMVHPFKYKGEYPCDNGEHVCHSFVRGGRIEFLGDCSHELAGQTVDLPDWDDATDVVS
ncbi:MAG: ammonia monooxygenase [Armatimonadetes bacterium]|nr:ammonia monooxygenase [Armatimonadota bacterium]